VAKRFPSKEEISGSIPDSAFFFRHQQFKNTKTLRGFVPEGFFLLFAGFSAENFE
jgi:hypothetical protein